MSTAASVPDISAGKCRITKITAQSNILRSVIVLGICGLFLIVPDACMPRGAHKQIDLGAEKHRPQARSRQATLLPQHALAWLQGRNLRGRLEDGRPIEITTFLGTQIQARLLTAPAAEETAIRLHPTELVGMQWHESRCAAGACTQRTFRITQTAPDSSRNTISAHDSNSDTWLYKVESTADPAGDDWRSVCAQAPNDSDMGLFVTGRWSDGGSWRADGYTFSCPGGVVAKCARNWGYKPWQSRATPMHGVVDMRPLHLACVRATRADYCGNGVSYTRDGERIGLSDRYGFNAPPPPHARIESSFDVFGAVQIYQPRIPSLMPTCAPKGAAAAGRTAMIQVWR